MDQVFVQLAFDPPAEGPCAVRRIGRGVEERGVDTVPWRGAALAIDRRRALLWFGPGDADRVRAALGPWAARADVWAGTLEGAPSIRANVLVERGPAGREPAEPKLPPALASGDWCLRTHRVRPVCRLVSRDGGRVVLLYGAPDAESVRLAERHTRGLADATWAFEWLGPDPHAAADARGPDHAGRGRSR